jgi:hypothetical protein
MMNKHNDCAVPTDARPHVYMFQCKALVAAVTQGTPSSTSVTVQSIVRGLATQLDSGHALSVCGPRAAHREPRSCISALQFGERVNATNLSAPFSVVLLN